MSLAALNKPYLVGALGLAAYGALPLVEQAIADADLGLIKVLNIGLYALNVYATSQPGRIDGPRQEEQIKGTGGGKDKTTTTTTSQQQQQQDDEPDISDYLSGKSLLTPSGWAFAIWGPIFLGELAFVTSSAVMVTDASVVAPVYKSVSGSFMMSQVFQSLWAASFRPAYKGNLAFIAPCMLTGIAVSLSRAHGHYASAASAATVSMPEYFLYFLPMTLHFGWTTAASLVNWNGSLAMNKNIPNSVVTAAGHLSAVTATGLGVYLTVTRQAPVFGTVIAWALSACSTGIQKRIDEQTLANSKDKDAKVDDAWMRGARVQKWLCAVGALISAASSASVSL